ncbi:MAG: YHYH protein [Marinoscillum sp.]
MKHVILLVISLCYVFLAQSQTTCNTTDIFDDDNKQTNQYCFEVDDNIRYIYSNNYPDHSDDYNQPQFTMNGEDGQDYDYSYTMCAYPEEAEDFTPLYEETEVSVGCTDTYEFGVSINGVRYDPSSAVTFVANEDDGDDTNDYNNLDWHVEATSSTNTIGANMGELNGGHLNPSGEYHYHAVPTDYFVNDLGIDGTSHSQIVGYAADGFPIYYKYVYSDPEDDESDIATATSGYTLKSGTRPGNGVTAPDGDYDGAYYEDYEYSSASTILDECNGRYGVTPDFPYGTYYYVITDEYPYIPRCFKGNVVDNTFRVGPTAACTGSGKDTQDDCSTVVEGCMDPFSLNYNENANLDDGSCLYSSATVIWSGSSWDNGSPTEADAVVIQGDYTFSTNGSFECLDLTVENGATITVDGENTLEVNGDIDVQSGNIVIASGSSLITYESATITGDAFTIKRNTRYADGKYSFVGSPVNQSSDLTGADLGRTVYKYNETTGFGNAGLNRWENASTDVLVPGKGYAQAFQKEIIFEGVPNDGTITFTGTFTDLTNSNPEGWNLVANPYAAAINVADFLDENDNITGAVYIWDDNNSASVRGSNDDYIIANGIAATQNSQAGNDDRYNQHLGSAQGFFVKLSGDSDLDITFTEDMRVTGENSDDNFFRTDAANIPYIRLNLTNDDGLFRQTVVGWVEDADNEKINRLYDAPVFNEDVDFSVYSIKAENKLAIQGVSPDFETIPIGVNIGEAGTYHIELNTDEYHSGQIYLYDKQVNEYIDLSNGFYTFSASSGQVTSRFSIHKARTVLSTSNNGSLVYTDGKTLYIKKPEVENTAYRLYDLSGLLVMPLNFNGSDRIDLSHLKNGVYIVSNGESVTKILLK